VNGTVLGDRYRVEARIGAGGMAEVYRGVDPVLNRPVAIKILLPQFARDASFVDRFRREAQAAARLNHPNVVAVYDTGSTDGTQWIVMEFIEGKTLQEFLATERRPSPEQACEIAERICDGLASAHSQGVIHRDIKPGNVMVTRSGAVKLMDLGIARMVTGPETAPQTSAVLGTATYMSPEQAQGQTVDARSDLYSLGAVLYELLTGRPPFSGESPVAIAYKQVNESPPPPSSLNPAVSPALDAVVMRALSKNPANRYQTASEFAEDLRNARTGGTVSATPLLPASEATQVISRPRPTSVLPPAEEPPGSGRKVWLGVLIGILVVATLAGAAFLIANFLTEGETTPTRNVVIPEQVIGMTEEDARAFLEDLGFQVPTAQREVTQDPDMVGLVVRTQPPAGTRVAEGSEVVLVIGIEPRRVEVPDLQGRTVEEAIVELEAAGLTLGVQTTEASEDFDEGKIIRTDPAAGTLVRRGEAVDVVVSSGSPLARLPSVVCRPVGAATSELLNLGFDVQQQPGTEPNPACPAPNRVWAQDPEGPADVEPGITVTLFTGLTTGGEGQG
jgi:beta-lactam-binding protein with PASTA domain/tRNA A-37 threonylcarbamoyl transferase component Bud32